MKQLLILSGKGGTGKTTIASAFIRLADAKAYADCDVCFVNSISLKLSREFPNVINRFPRNYHRRLRPSI